MQLSFVSSRIRVPYINSLSPSTDVLTFLCSFEHCAWPYITIPDHSYFFFPLKKVPKKTDPSLLCLNIFMVSYFFPGVSSQINDHGPSTKLRAPGSCSSSLSFPFIVYQPWDLLRAGVWAVTPVPRTFGGSLWPLHWTCHAGRLISMLFCKLYSLPVRIRLLVEEYVLIYKYDFFLILPVLWKFLTGLTIAYVSIRVLLSPQVLSFMSVQSTCPL